MGEISPYLTIKGKNKIKVILEGNIGSGKTSLLNKIKNPKYSKIFEPVDKFTLLKSFYEDPVKYAFPFQIQAAEVHLENEKLINKPCIFERSIDTSINIFASMLHDNGLISDSQMLELHDKYLSQSIPVSAFIYIDVDTHTCLERIIGRGRAGEENIKNEYLEKIKAKIDNLYEGYKRMSIPCLRINNATGRIDEAVDIVEEFLEKVLNDNSIQI